MLNVTYYQNETIDFLDNYDGFNYTNYLLKENDEIIGIITYIVNEDITDIFYIEIKEEHQNKGHGFYLIKNTMPLIKTKKIMLEVNETNINAIKLYQKLNFNVIDKRKKYYENFDALILERTTHE